MSKTNRNFLGLCATGMITLFGLVMMLRLWQAELWVPFNYRGDTIYELALVKSIANGGWIWHIPHLGAPFGLEIAAFPQNLTVSSLMMKVIALFTSEPGLILNLFWLWSILLTSIIAYLSLRALSVTNTSAIVMASLYALLPYAFFRNTAHISLTYIFVPVIAAFCVEVLASSRGQDQGKQNGLRMPRYLLWIAAVCIGFDYIYNAFFACFFLCVVMVVSLVYRRKFDLIRRVAPVLLVIMACTLLNMLPSIYSWMVHGVPPNMGYKTPAEAEIYGLKIRHMIVPLSVNYEAGHPLENENQSARLGVIGALGFLFAIFYGLFSVRFSSFPYRLKWAAGILVIIGTLTATIGGLGAVFNMYVSPEIRAYNRIVVFIAFFAFLLMGLQLDAAQSYLRNKFDSVNAGFLRLILSLIPLVVLIIGAGDQRYAASDLVSDYDRDLVKARSDREMVERLESTYPEVRNIYQLPETPFPPDSGRENMQAYDHGAAYVWSEHANWSWPNFSQRQNRLANKLKTSDTQEFVQVLMAFEFDGIWLDRFGYQDEELRDLEGKLGVLIGSAALVSENGRYAFYDLTEKKREWLSKYSAEDLKLYRDRIAEGGMFFKKGFYEEEIRQDTQDKFRWSNSKSVIEISNPENRIMHGSFHARIEGVRGGDLRVSYNGQQDSLKLGGRCCDISCPA